MPQGHTMAILPCGNLTPEKLPTGGGEWPTFCTARVLPYLPLTANIFVRLCSNFRFIHNQLNTHHEEVCITNACCRFRSQ